MFEKELDRERKALKSALATSHQYVTLQSILANEQVHAAYRTYFQAESAWWVHEERAIRTSNPRFDTADEEFAKLGTKMDGEYARTARFDHEELNATIDAAVKTRLNYLCRPRTTLKWFVFRGEPTKPINEVLLRLRYFSDYTYLTDGIRQWAKSRTAESTSTYEILSIIEFERVIDNVDNDAILDLSQHEFVALLEPMYEFFVDASPDIPPETVPTESVIIYLDDKGAIPISQALERSLYREELKFLTRSKFLDVIDKVIAEIETVSSEQGVGSSEQGVGSSEQGVGSSEQGVGSSEQGVGSSEQGVGSSEQGVASSEQGVASVVEDPALDLRRLKFADSVDSSQRERILVKLFSGDAAMFDSVVADVLSCEKWKDAMSALDRWYAKQSIEPNGAVAMEFAHALNRTYR